MNSSRIAVIILMATVIIIKTLFCQEIKNYLTPVIEQRVLWKCIIVVLNYDETIKQETENYFNIEFKDSAMVQ